VLREVGSTSQRSAASSNPATSQTRTRHDCQCIGVEGLEGGGLGSRVRAPNAVNEICSTGKKNRSAGPPKFFGKSL